MMCEEELDNRWNEDLSQAFMDYGRYFVPEREGQINTIVQLLPGSSDPFRVVELCCGEGQLAEAILERFPEASVIGYDGSHEMREAARQRLARFGVRFEAWDFNLGELSWRSMDSPVDAVVTSLAVHHLEGDQKAQLFGDIFRLLLPGGVFIIADIVDPVHPSGKELAAEAYDEVVRSQSQDLDGDSRAFDFFRREGWNIFRYLDPEDIDKPSSLYDQLKWLELAGFIQIDVYWMRAGHAIFGGWKP